MYGMAVSCPGRVWKDDAIVCHVADVYSRRKLARHEIDIAASYKADCHHLAKCPGNGRFLAAQQTSFNASERRNKHHRRSPMLWTRTRSEDRDRDSNDSASGQYGQHQAEVVVDAVTGRPLSLVWPLPLLRPKSKRMRVQLTDPQRFDSPASCWSRYCSL